MVAAAVVAALVVAAAVVGAAVVVQVEGAIAEIKSNCHCNFIRIIVIRFIYTFLYNIKDIYYVKE